MHVGTAGAAATCRLAGSSPQVRQPAAGCQRSSHARTGTLDPRIQGSATGAGSAGAAPHRDRPQRPHTTHRPPGRRRSQHHRRPPSAHAFPAPANSAQYTHDTHLLGRWAGPRQALPRPRALAPCQSGGGTALYPPHALLAAEALPANRCPCAPPALPALPAPADDVTAGCTSAALPPSDPSSPAPPSPPSLTCNVPAASAGQGRIHESCLVPRLSRRPLPL
jgi:hypothetical protein